jgi:hypothetical protein
MVEKNGRFAGEAKRPGGMRRHYRGWRGLPPVRRKRIPAATFNVQIFRKFQRGQESDQHLSPNVVRRSTFLMLEVDGTHVVLTKRDQPATAEP